jgi:uncharacterized SAM-dependent methyltransferase
MSIFQEYDVTFPDKTKATLRRINRYFRDQDESHKWPIHGRFNVTERAIRQLREERQHCVIEGGLEYWLALDQHITLAVNRAW